MFGAREMGFLMFPLLISLLIWLVPIIFFIVVSWRFMRAHENIVIVLKEIADNLKKQQSLGG
jgi:hypothetical protein